MVRLLRVLRTACQVDINVGVALTIFLAFVDPGYLVTVLAILIIVVMATVVRVTLLIEVV